jgi:hypothetical protein
LNHVGGITISNFKLHYRVTVTKQTQTNGIEENPEVSLYCYNHAILFKSGKNTLEKKIASSSNGVGKTDIHM